jgi:hypothetical protein
MCLITSAAPAVWGQYFEIWGDAGKSYMVSGSLGTPTVRIGAKETDVQLTDGLRFGFRVAFNSDRPWGHEIFFGINNTHLKQNAPPPTFEESMHFFQYGYNFLYYANHEGSRFRPFATGGLELVNFVPPGGNPFYGGSLKFGVNYGGGLKIRVAGPWAIRFDFRQHVMSKPFDLYLNEGWLRQNEVSGGIGFLF